MTALPGATNCSAEEALDSPHPNIVIQEIEASSGEKAFLPGDFNDDGLTDLIIAEEDHGRILVFINDGDGRLNRVAAYPVGAQPSWLTTLDFDNDGINDLAIANHESDSVTLLRGRGDARFEQGGGTRVPIESAPHTHMIAAADLDGDGVSDLVIDSRDQFGIYVLRGDSEGGFDAPGTGIDVGGSPYLGFAVGDLNRDGRPDIVTPNQNNISVLLNRSTANLTFERIDSISVQSPFAMNLADVNGDNRIDILVASASEDPGVAIYAGDGNGQFEILTSMTMAAGAKIIASGDINADGRADAVITGWNAEIVLLIGHADRAHFIQLPTNGIRNPWGAAIADFNMDGRDDVLVGDATSGRVHIYTIESLNE